MPPKKQGATKKAYGMAPVIPAGEIVSNFHKKRWKIGKSFATGGFGRLYYAEEVSEDRKSKQKVVIKMEPAENGPLFQETHVYQRVAKPEMLQSWMKTKGLKFLGIPAFLGSGRHEKDKYEFRFLVIPHLGSDLESVRSKTPKLPPGQVFQSAKCILNSLEYLHSVQYVHADVKAENLLFSTSASADMTKLVLVDFGLAKRVADKPVFRENPKKADDGTLIFTSIDAHKGAAPSYRGDVEILAYNILYWITGSLPWFKDTNSAVVLQKKTDFSKSLQKSLRSILGAGVGYGGDLEKFCKMIYALDYAEKPNYDQLHKVLDSAIRNSGLATNSGGRRSLSVKRKVEELSVNSDDESSEDEVVPKTPTPSPPRKKAAATGRARKTLKTKSSSSEDSLAGPSSSSGRVIPGLANMVPVMRNGKNGPVLIPTATGTGKGKSVGETLVKKYVEKERTREKSGGKKKKAKAELVEEETQTSPSMWTAEKKK